MAFCSESMLRLSRVKGVRLLGHGDTSFYIPGPEVITDPITLMTALNIEKQHEDFSSPSVLISGLEPIYIAELTSGTQALGRVLHGRLTTDAIKVLTGNIITTLQDGSDHIVLLCIKYAVGWETSDAQVRGMFPRGARVAIKQPCFMAGLVPPIIVIDNPANIEVRSYFSDEKLASFGGMTVEQLRMEGNRLYNDKSFYCAAELYRLSAAKSSVDGVPAVVLAHSNRSACLFKLGKFEEAVDAADAALKLDPKHVKSMYRKGMALLKLQLYVWASQVLQDAVSAAPNDHGVFQAYARCQRLADESKDGSGLQRAREYWLAVSLAGQTIPEPPELGEYVGPVEVRMCEDQSQGRGRGLFATRDVKRGELLLVNHPLGFSQADKGDVSVGTRDVAVELMNKAMHSPAARRQIYSLQCSEVPPVSYYVPNWTCAESWTNDAPRGRLEGFEMRKTFEIASIAAFQPKAIGSFKSLYTGVWGLPSFINSACTGNVTSLEAGSTVLYLAVRDIQAGEELVHSYTQPFMPLKVRRQRLPYDCTCKRCDLEKQLDEPLKEVSSCFGDETRGLIRIKEDTDVFKVVAQLEQAISNVDEESQQMVRASYCALYELYLNEPRLGPVTPERLMEDLHRACSGYKATASKMARLMHKANDKKVARALLKAECQVVFGEQETEVYERLVKVVLSGAFQLLAKVV